MMGEGRAGRGDTPEAIFFAWLVAQPQDVDIAAAARLEIARLGRIDIATETRARLIGLLTQAAVVPPGASRRERRQRH
jgi:hypothetical protein